MDDFKLKVVQEYLRTNATVSEIQKKFGIGCRSCIPDWVRKFGLKNPLNGKLNLKEP